MAKKELRQLLAGLGVAGLITAGGIAVPGAHAAGSGWGATKDSAGSAVKVEKPAGSGWGGSKDSAVSAATEKVDEKAKEAVEATADGAAKASDTATPPKPKKAAIEGCWFHEAFKLTPRGKRAATKQYSEYGEKPRSAADEGAVLNEKVERERISFRKNSSFLTILFQAKAGDHQVYRL